MTAITVLLAIVGAILLVCVSFADDFLLQNFKDELETLTRRVNKLERPEGKSNEQNPD